MDLLRQVRADALDPGYRQATSTSDPPGPRRPRRGVVATVTVLVLSGVLLGSAWRSTVVRAPVVAQERGQLVQRVESARARQASQSAQVQHLRSGVASLRAASQQATATAQTSAAVRAGVAAASGPGVVVTLDDGPHPTSGQIVDTDLRRVVNALWEAGAEAIAVNDHRLTTRTAIRAAGSAITVDYVSLTRPYRIVALGSPTQLPGRLAQTPGGRWAQYLHDNYSVSYTVSPRDHLEVPGQDLGDLSAASAHR